MRPRVGISQCLAGGHVRYDGGHKLERPLMDVLGPLVEWVTVCPEVEVGMSVPREPVRLVAGGVGSGAAGARLIALHSGRDWTAVMDDWSHARVRGFASMRLSGYVLKSRSPSCGLHGVPIHGSEEASGRGLFAAALVAAWPDLPVDDEEGLREPSALRAFLDRVRAFHHSRWEAG